VVRVTAFSDRQLDEIAPGIRRAIFFDSREGARSLSLGMAELAAGAAIPLHRHDVEEGFHVMEGDGVVVVGEEESQIRAGSFCVMPAGEYHTIRNTGRAKMRLLITFSGTDVKLERKP
jgi:quercetin dioxygenase-like cupin family protein